MQELISSNFAFEQCSQSIKTGKKLDSETLIIFAKNIGHFPIYTSDTTTKRYNEFYSLIPSTSNNAVNPSKEESITGSIHKSLPLKNNDENRLDDVNEQIEQLTEEIALNLTLKWKILLFGRGGRVTVQ
ncbi:Flavin-dependent tryptophan halogenase PrnA [Dirofilaria immitis]